MEVRPVRDDQWSIVEWMWQAYRNDMAHLLTGSLPWSDGRYKHEPLDAHPGSDGHAGFLGWHPHPQQGEDAPVALALVDGIGGERRSITAFWVVPGGRRTGWGRQLALDVIGRYPRPWTIAFQHDNAGAGRFWRGVAQDAFGDGWTEEQRPVPDRPELPPDHWIESP